MAKVQSVIAYLKNNDAFGFSGGVPTSLLETGQLWDFGSVIKFSVSVHLSTYTLTY